jgi:hypothetical protein
MRRLVLAGVLALPLATAAGAHAAADIEGTWTFGQGQVSVIQQADGRFAGTVVKATSFSSCAHPVGQKMWIDMAAQPDGQYFGKHQWFKTGGGCDPNGLFGPTAWRVLPQPDGKKLLRVCFTAPSHPESQPSIAPDGTQTGARDGDGYNWGDGQPCEDSTFVAPLSKPTFQNTVVLPSQGKRKCRSRRSFRIRLRNPAGDPLVRATVKVNGKQVRVVKGARLTAPVDLRGLPKGRYTVSITATTTLGRTIKGSRKYRTCTPKRR